MDEVLNVDASSAKYSKLI